MGKEQSANEIGNCPKAQGFEVDGRLEDFALEILSLGAKAWDLEKDEEEDRG